MPYRRILCATDLDERSRPALRAAAAFAAEDGASLTLVHVQAEPRMGWPGFTAEARFAEALGRLAEDQLGAWKRAAETLCGRAVEASLLVGVPWDRIVELARAGGHDLVVLGAHGRSGLAHVLVGSVAEKVVRHAPAAVLVVR